MSIQRKLIFSLITFFFAYAVADAITTVYYLRGELEPVSIWILEDTGLGSTIRFDPLLGYRLTKTPARMACIATNGVIESVGTIRGNNHGFPDRDDFQARKSDPNVKRFAVFGDSFSAAQFLEINWPDRCEDLARKAGRPIQLLNLSIDGGGHTNWTRTLEGFIDAGNYELDGVIFAVYGNDLRRPFVIWDDQVIQTGEDGMRTIGFGTVWNAALPRTLEEALPFFHGLPRWQVHPTEDFDRMLQGELRPSDGRSGTYLMHRMKELFTAKNQITRQFTLDDVVAYHHHHDPGRIAMWNDIRSCLNRRNLPSMVVDVPALEYLLDGSGASAEAQAFAQLIGAKFVDGAQGFKGLSVDEIRACWLPYDAHWGQAGSDRFAAYMVEVLADWP